MSPPSSGYDPEVPKTVTREDVEAAVAKLWASYEGCAANDLIKPGPPRGFTLSLYLEFDGGRGFGPLIAKELDPHQASN